MNRKLTPQIHIRKHRVFRNSHIGEYERKFPKLLKNENKKNENKKNELI